MSKIHEIPHTQKKLLQSNQRQSRSLLWIHILVELGAIVCDVSYVALCIWICLDQSMYMTQN